MKATAVRSAPVKPPIEKIVLEVSTNEARVIEALSYGESWGEIHRTLVSEGLTSQLAADVLDAVSDTLEVTLQKAGIALIRL